MMDMNQLTNFFGFGQQQGMGGPRINPKVIGVVVVAAAALLLTVVGDSAVFGKTAPKGILPILLSYPIVFAYKVFGDRLMSFVSVLLIWLSIWGVIGYFAYIFIMERIVEPMMIKRKLQRLKREKELINKFDDGTI